jgi:hypothetical protein
MVAALTLEDITAAAMTSPKSSLFIKVRMPARIYQQKHFRGTLLKHWYQIKSLLGKHPPVVPTVRDIGGGAPGNGLCQARGAPNTFR